MVVALPFASRAYVPFPFDGLASPPPVITRTTPVHEVNSYNAVGNLLTTYNAVTHESFTYDVMDRVASATTTVNGHTFASQWKRDLGGLVTNLVYAPGKAVSRAYDPGGRLASVSDWLGHTWNFTHDGAGKPTGGTAPGGILSTNQYDAAGRLARWSVGTLAGRTITRDAAGLKTRDDITAGPLPAPHNVRYAENTFDAADSLVAASVRYGSHTNAAVPETYLYDGNGALTNLISGFTNVFSAAYNPLGQLSSLRSSAFFAANYLYDALGNRIVSGDRLWIPDHADLLKRPLIEADAATGTPIRYYLWAPGRLLGFIDADSGTLTVAHCDEYGSVVALTDASGAVLHTACYGPNGQDWGTTGGNPTPFAWLGGHGVQKAAVSDHLGPLYLTRYRLYSASLNRFLSPDPLGLAGGLNLYAYADGDPLSYIDPQGLCAKRDYSHDAHNSELWAYRPPPYSPQPTATLYDTTRDPRSRALMHADMLLPEAAIGTAIGDHLATSMTVDTFTAPGLAIIGGGIAKAVGKVLGGAKYAPVKYPPNRGFMSGEGNPSSVLPGTIVDRYGSSGGSFLSPQGTPVTARSLAPSVKTRPLNAYQVVKPFGVDAGRAAPWFGQPGKGMQYDLGTRTVQDLINSGHLRPLQ